MGRGPHESFAGDHGLYAAALSALARAPRGALPNPTKVEDLRALIALQIAGHPRKRLPGEMIEAEIRAVETRAFLIEGAWRAPPRLSNRDLQGNQRCLWNDEGRWVVAERVTPHPIETPSELRALIAYTPPDDAESLYAALAYLVRRRTCSADAAAAAITPGVVQETKTAAQESVREGDRQMALETTFIRDVRALLHAAVESLAPAARQALVARRERFDRKFPYSPLRNAVEHRLVSHYLTAMKAANEWGHDTAAAPIAEMHRARVRIWSTCPDDTLKLYRVEVPRQEVAPNQTLDLLNLGTNHFICLLAFAPGLQVPNELPQENFTIPSEAALQLDLGGTGDCFFRAAAYGLDMYGVRDSRSPRVLTRVAHELRLSVVQAWVDAIKDARRGDDTRVLVAELISKAQF